MTAILDIMHSNFELRGYTVKKHGRHRGMRDLNEIGTSMGQTMGGYWLNHGSYSNFLSLKLIILKYSRRKRVKFYILFACCMFIAGLFFKLYIEILF